jgi:hypothetical protein
MLTPFKPSHPCSQSENPELLFRMPYYFHARTLDELPMGASPWLLVSFFVGCLHGSLCARATIALWGNLGTAGQYHGLGRSWLCAQDEMARHTPCMTGPSQLASSET